MAKFNSATTIKTTNKDGHVAYGMDDKLKLVTQVTCSFINENKYYGDNTAEIKKTIQKVVKEDSQFVSNLAVYARREFNMRSVAHVLTAYLANAPEGKPYVRKTIQGISVRGDDVTELMACYISEFGKPIPNSMKKGIADVLNGFDEYTLAKYKGEGNAVKMRDLICMCHPKPKTKEQEELFKKCLEGNLAIPETWETQLSANGNNKDTWEKLIDSGKVGYMALLRNCRNILNARPNNIQKVFDKLADPEAVRKSRQLPFRFMSAYRSAMESNNASSKVLKTLEDAFNASIDNLEKIPGRTVIAIDVSGSMGSKISAKSDVRCSDIAILIGLIANQICEDAIVYTFDDRIERMMVPPGCAILYTAVNYYPRGGGTNMDLPFEAMIRNRIDADRIIVLSDNMCNGGWSYWNRKTVQSLADEYRRKSGKNIWVHAIDLQGYGTQQFHGTRTNIIAGWSEKVLSFILLAEAGATTLEKTISEYKW